MNKNNFLKLFFFQALSKFFALINLHPVCIHRPCTVQIPIAFCINRIYLINKYIFNKTAYYVKMWCVYNENRNKVSKFQKKLNMKNIVNCF